MKSRTLMAMVIVGAMLIGQVFVSDSFGHGPMMGAGNAGQMGNGGHGTMMGAGTAGQDNGGYGPMMDADDMGQGPMMGTSDTASSETPDVSEQNPMMGNGQHHGGQMMNGTMGKPMGMTGDPVTVTGTVSEATLRYMKIKTAATTIVTIYGLGPATYWEGLGVAMPNAGDQITVQGLSNTFMGSDNVIAVSVTVNGKTVRLHDSETGRPLWMKARNNQT